MWVKVFSEKCSIWNHECVCVRERGREREREERENVSVFMDLHSYLYLEVRAFDCWPQWGSIPYETDLLMQPFLVPFLSNQFHLRRKKINEDWGKGILLCVLSTHVLSTHWKEYHELPIGRKWTPIRSDRCSGLYRKVFCKAHTQSI